jgi:hypothetical protein
MKRRTLLKSALGALTFGLVGQSKPAASEWRHEILPVSCYDARPTLTMKGARPQGMYTGRFLCLQSSGESRLIVEDNGRTLTLNAPWNTTPPVGATFKII